MTMTSAFAAASPFAAERPPNPAPTMTICGRAGSGAVNRRPPSECRLRQRLFGGGDALDLMRLEPRQDLAREALDLVHEQIVRQAAAVHRELHLVGAGALRGVDDALGDLV